MLAAGWGLTACSGDDGEAAAQEERPQVIAPGAPGEDAEILSPEEAAERLPEPGEPDAADIGYMHRMVDHHGQALQMSELALERAENEAVRGIAERIAASQGPEIEVMRAWLDDRGAGGEPGDHEGHGDHGEHGGEGEAMPGMARPEELAELAAAEGVAFDALFLELMTRHHEGAVTMAAEVLGTTTDQTVEQLATDVIATQNAEIDRMAALA
ncbi:DUF305 domain-containing protein [Streptomyces triticirhizae]|uniref:DUF305 domain-containing protein n=2 Tax=Streptomyces triticirhizae TaxID=2483353 RepID=A0A3M2LKA9_9ACTN|nr:DUF305 domain-containing protein [Streptomyces triticirhizae]